MDIFQKNCLHRLQHQAWLAIYIKFKRLFPKADDLYTENWILSYEALVKGWLESKDGIDYITSDSIFSAFRDNGVEFYDTSKLASPLDLDFSEPEEGEGGISESHVEYDFYDALDY